MPVFFSIALVLLLASCASPTLAPPATVPSKAAIPALSPPAPREQIKGIEDYIVYYGTGRADDLARHDLAIVQPETLTAEELAALKEKHVLTVAYLSVGEAEPGRPWYSDGRVDLRWLLGKNENWGSYFVDTRQAGWQRLMVELTGEFLQKGFDGVFLDTVDTVDAFPETREGMIALIQGVRAAYPTALLVQNRGFSVMKEVASDIDAVMFEDLSTGYDFDTGEYTLQEDEATAQEMVELHQQTGLPILALDYAPPDNPGRAYRAVQDARKYGFVPAVSVIMLDDIPDYGLDKGGPADLRIRSIRAKGDGEQMEIVVTIENVGLSDASQALAKLSVDDEPLTSLTRSLAAGDRFEWIVDWPDPKPVAKIEAAVDFQDLTPDDNHLSYDYTWRAAALAVEPLLPPEEQKRRPAANGPDMTAKALTTPVTIDGDLSDWPDFPCAQVNTKEQVSYGDPAQWGGPQDLSGEICYAWDKDGLYVAVYIHDDTVVQRYSGASLWKGDHVELWFDTQLQLDFDSAEASDDDYQLGISPGDFDKVKPSFFIWQPATPQERYQDLVEYTVVRAKDGYVAEARIPIQVLEGLRLADSHAIGATFEPSDTDTPGGSEQEMMMSSAPKSSAQWGNPTLWNNLIFDK